jgi:phage terminase large subunit GpA-like protein
MTKVKGRWRAAVDVVAESAAHAFAGLLAHVAAVARGRRLEPPMDGVTWLESALRIPVGEGTIPFRFEDVPALREPFQMATAPGFSRGCLVKPVQAAATTVFCIGLPAYKLASRGENVVATWATVDDAQKFSKTKLDPIVEASPKIAALFAPADRGNDTRSTILIKKAVRGILFMLGTNSPRMLRMLSAPTVVNDEVSSYVRNAGDEGSVIAKAWGRSTSFEDPVQWMQSTPLLKGDCLITEQYEQSDQRIFEVRCPHCAEFFAPLWSMVKWEKVVVVDGDVTETKVDVAEGEVVVKHLTAGAWLECPLCAGVISERMRRAVVQDHRYRVQRPDVTDLMGWSFNFYASLMPGMRLPMLVSQYLRALRDPEEMQQFVNEIEARVYTGVVSALDVDAINDRREVYAAEVPKEVGYLTSFTDVQADRLECLVVGWGASQESWVIGLVRIPGDPTDEHDPCWAQLAAIQTRAYQHESGAPMYIQRSGIDRGFAAEAVEAFVRAHQKRGVIQTIGRNRFDKPVLIRQSRKRKDGRTRVVPLFWIGTDTAKDRLFQRLKRTSGPGAIHHPTHLPDDAIPQYKAEVSISRKVRAGTGAGTSVRSYRKVEDRNEMIDLMVGSMAMLAHAGDVIRNNLHALALRMQADGASRVGALVTTPSPFTAPLPEPVVPVTPGLPVARRRRVLSAGLKR